MHCERVIDVWCSVYSPKVLIAEDLKTVFFPGVCFEITDLSKYHSVLSKFIKQKLCLQLLISGNQLLTCASCLLPFDCSFWIQTRTYDWFEDRHKQIKAINFPFFGWATTLEQTIFHLVASEILLFEGTSEGNIHVNQVSKVNSMTFPRAFGSAYLNASLTSFKPRPHPCTSKTRYFFQSCRCFVHMLTAWFQHARVFKLINRHRLAWHYHNCSLCAIACALDHCVVMHVPPCLHIIPSTFDTLKHLYHVDTFACWIFRELLLYHDHYFFPKEPAATFHVNMCHCLIGNYNIKLLRMRCCCQAKWKDSPGHLWQNIHLLLPQSQR